MARQNFLHTLRFLLWLTTYKAQEYANDKVSWSDVDKIRDRLKSSKIASTIDYNKCTK
jgi:hypothetical protein